MVEFGTTAEEIAANDYYKMDLQTAQLFIKKLDEENQLDDEKIKKIEGYIR